MKKRLHTVQGRRKAAGDQLPLRHLECHGGKELHQQPVPGLDGCGCKDLQDLFTDVHHV